MMTSWNSWRVLTLAPTLLAAGLILSACETAPARPTAPISTGEPRVDPLPPREPDADRPDVETGELGVVDDTAEAPPELTPPHMRGREITRAAILLPFTHPNREVRTEAQGMLAAIELALFERAGDSFLLIPKDTRGTRATAREQAAHAMDEGADIILGPLFSNNVQAVSPAAHEADIPVLAFSNDPAAAGEGAWLAAIPVEEEVARVVRHAVAQGVEQFAFLGPRSAYGRRVEGALRQEVARLGAQILHTRFYAPENDAPVDAAKEMADILKPAIEARPDQVALMIPEAGVRLRSVAPLIPYYGVDFRKLRMLGTSQWDDETVWREPTLAGSWYPVPPPDAQARFSDAYRRVYGRAPSALASLGYDAAALAIGLDASEAGISRASLASPDGFMGTNGLFRFRADGTTQRSLAIMEIDPREGAVMVDEGRKTFADTVG